MNQRSNKPHKSKNSKKNHDRSVLLATRNNHGQYSKKKYGSVKNQTQSKQIKQKKRNQQSVKQPTSTYNYHENSRKKHGREQKRLTHTEHSDSKSNFATIDDKKLLFVFSVFILCQFTWGVIKFGGYGHDNITKGITGKYCSNYIFGIDDRCNLYDFYLVQPILYFSLYLTFIYSVVDKEDGQKWFYNHCCTVDNFLFQHILLLCLTLADILIAQNKIAYLSQIFVNLFGYLLLFAYAHMPGEIIRGIKTEWESNSTKNESKCKKGLLYLSHYSITISNTRPK